MNEAFLKGFVKAAHTLGLSERQTCQCVIKYAQGLPPGPNMMPPIGGSNQMAAQGQPGMPPGGAPGQMQQQPGAQPQIPDGSIPQANQGQMEPQLSLASVMPQKMPGPQVSPVLPNFMRQQQQPMPQMPQR